MCLIVHFRLFLRPELVKTLPTHRLPEVCDEVEVEQLVTQVPYLSAGFPAVDLFGRAVIVDVVLGAGLVSCGLSEVSMMTLEVFPPSMKKLFSVICLP
jgi:hypothetical protein